MKPIKEAINGILLLEQVVKSAEALLSDIDKALTTSAGMYHRNTQGFLNDMCTGVSVNLELIKARLSASEDNLVVASKREIAGLSGASV